MNRPDSLSDSQHREGSEQPSLPGFKTWRGVYIFAAACFVVYVVLLTVLSRAFS